MKKKIFERFITVPKWQLILSLICFAIAIFFLPIMSDYAAYDYNIPLNIWDGISAAILYLGCILSFSVLPLFSLSYSELNLIINVLKYGVLVCLLAIFVGAFLGVIIGMMDIIPITFANHSLISSQMFWANVFFSLGYLFFRFIYFNQVISFFNYFWNILSNAEVRKAIVAFLFSYFGIIILFGMIYSFIYVANPEWSFSTPFKQPTLFHFIYFSVITSTTLGYGDISPRSNIAIFFCSIEVIISVVLVGLYLGAVISTLSNNRPRKID